MAKRKNKPRTNRGELISGKGYYYGTTLSSSRWRRYEGNDLFERGYCELWLTRDALYFRRYLTMEPVKIPTKAITNLTTGHSHAGKFTLALIIKIHWSKSDKELISGFMISRDPKELMQWQRKFQKVLKAKFL